MSLWNDVFGPGFGGKRLGRGPRAPRFPDPPCTPGPPRDPPPVRTPDPACRTGPDPRLLDRLLGHPRRRR